MKLNTLKPAAGSRKSAMRVGRGHSAGKGKTCGRGHKGQHARAGGYHKTGFEGGQMPIQRRLPKIGFVSPKKSESAELRLHELDIPGVDVIDLAILKVFNRVAASTLRVKVIASGKISRAVTIKGLKVTPGARQAIEAAGGSITEA